MARSKSQFVCQQCGYSQSQWAGKCPSCDVWNSMVETTLEIRKQDAGDRSLFEKLHTDIVFNLIEWTGFDTKYALQTKPELS